MSGEVIEEEITRFGNLLDPRAGQERGAEDDGKVGNLEDQGDDDALVSNKETGEREGFGGEGDDPVPKVCEVLAMQGCLELRREVRAG